MAAHRDPAVFVKSAVAEHLEVLDMALLGGAGVFEAVHHADALDGLLLYAIDLGGLRNIGGFEDGRGDVYNVVELHSLSAWIGDVARPGYDQRIPRSAEVRS